MKRSMRVGPHVLIGLATGLALVAGTAAPASAAETPPGDPPAALTEWVSPALRTVSVGKLATPAVTTPSVIRTSPITGGRRLTDKRGSFLMWTQNNFEWWWTSKKMSSSKAWQTKGFVFPNIAKNAGIKRTAKFATRHIWRASNTVGAGVVTPWGDVTVYSTTITDHYTLKRGGGYSLK